MNISRGNIAYLSKPESVDQNLSAFCDKNQYTLNAFTKIDALIAGLKSRKYLAVILDCEFPNLFEIYHQNNTSLFNVIEGELMTPVIIAANKDPSVERSISLIGLKRVIGKPLDEDVLVALLVELTIPPLPETGVFEDDYCGLFIDDFIYIKYCPFDIFCRLSENKGVKILNAYDTINKEFLERLKNKGVSRLFLKRADYKKLIAINAYSQNKGIEGKERLQWISSTTQTLLDDVYHDEVNLETFFAAKQVVESTLDLCADNNMMFELIKALNELSSDIYKQALGMSVYSVLIASKMGMNDPKIKFRLSMAGLFADMGMKQINPELLDKSRILYNFKEQAEYIRHPDYAVDILRGIDGLPEEILQVISQHHENLDGSGFPRRITKNQIHPLAKILRVADEFCFLTLRTKHNNNVLSPLKALEELKKPYNQTRFDKNAVDGLETLLLEKSKIGKKAA